MFNTLIRRNWNPLNGFGINEFEVMERVFEDIFHENPAKPGSPKAEHWVKDEAAHMVMELPGVNGKDVEIAMEGKTLTISGERKAPELTEGETWSRRERWHGKFQKEYSLPFNVEEGKVKARFHDGLLEVSLPKAESEKPRKIAISAK